MMANMVNMKTVGDRVKEFASANDKLLKAEIMVLGEKSSKQVEEPRPEGLSFQRRIKLKEN